MNSESWQSMNTFHEKDKDRAFAPRTTSVDCTYMLDGKIFTTEYATAYLKSQGFSGADAIRYKKLLRDELKVS